VLVVAACGGARGRTATSTPQTPVAARAADWLVPLLPDGAQLVVELDLARLRANAVVGAVATQVLGELGADARLPGLPVQVQGSPLAGADYVVLAAYGVGTAQATTILLLATKAQLPNAVRVTSDIAVLGDADWVDQVAHRAAIAKLYPDAPAPVGEHLTLVASDELAKLRDHAMPPGAPGATVRVTARLPFDARVAFTRLMGLEAAPAQLSLWADIVDDAAVIIDADAADPGNKDPKDARKRLLASLARILEAVAAEPAVRAIGVSPNIVNATVKKQGTWVRAIIQIGPRQLGRVVQRVNALLAAPPAPLPAEAPAPTSAE
jgi:hypothetical protein